MPKRGRKRLTIVKAYRRKEQEKRKKMNVVVHKDIKIDIKYEPIQYYPNDYTDADKSFITQSWLNNITEIKTEKIEKDELTQNCLEVQHNSIGNVFNNNSNALSLSIPIEEDIYDMPFIKQSPIDIVNEIKQENIDEDEPSKDCIEDRYNNNMLNNKVNPLSLSIPQYDYHDAPYIKLSPIEILSDIKEENIDEGESLKDCVDGYKNNLLNNKVNTLSLSIPQHDYHDAPYIKLSPIDISDIKEEIIDVDATLKDYIDIQHNSNSSISLINSISNEIVHKQLHNPTPLVREETNRKEEVCRKSSFQEQFNHYVGNMYIDSSNITNGSTSKDTKENVHAQSSDESDRRLVGYIKDDNLNVWRLVRLSKIDIEQHRNKRNILSNC